MANEMAMMLKIKADASQARSEMRGVEGSVNALEGIGQGLASAFSGNFSALGGQVGGLASNMASIHPAGMVATAAVGALTAAAGAAATTIWQAATAAAEYGGRLQDLADKTGLSAEFLSSLDMAAQESGTSVEELGGSFTKFNKLIGEAAAGSKEATDKLKQFGIGPKEALNDMEGSLKKVFARIAAMPTAAQQTKAAIDAFGKSGAAIIPVLKNFGGDMDGLIAKAREMGVAINDSTLASMDEFDDTLTRTKGQLSALWRQFGTQFLPVLTDGMRSLSKWFSENKQAVTDFGTSASNVLRGTLEVLKDIKKWFDENPKVVETLKFLYNTSTIGMTLNYLGSRGQTAAAAAPAPSPTDTTDVDPEEAIQAQLERMKRVSAALDKIGKITVDNARKTYETESKELIRQFENSLIGFDEFSKKMIAALSAYQAVAIRENARSMGVQLANTELLQEEMDAIKAQGQADANALFEETKNQIKVIQDVRDKVEKTKNDERYKALEAQLNREDQLSRARSEAHFAWLESEKKKGYITESQLNKAVHLENVALLESRIKAMQQLIQASTNPEQKKELENQLNILFAQRQLLTVKRQIQVIDEKNEGAEKKKKLAEELLALEEQIAQLVSQRAEDARTDELAALEAMLRTSFDRTAILQQMAVIETVAAEETHKRRLKDLEREKQAALERVKGKENEEEQKRLIEELYRQRGLIAEEEFQRRLKEIRQNYANNQPKTPTEIIAGQLENFKNTIGSVGASMATLTDMMFQSVDKIAQGVGSMVEQWVLYGETGPAAMRKVLAAALASFAAEAAINAVRAAAYGFLFLALQQYANAAAAFKSAALWGAVAVGAMVAGRAVAGDAFKKQTSTGSNTGTASSSSSSNGGAYSSLGDQTVDVSRNNPYGIVPRESVVVIKDKSGMFSQLFASEIENNSRVRQTILKLVD